MNQHITPHVTLPNPNYFGGKAGSGTFQTIINCIRPHQHYVEGCAGNASVFRLKSPALLTQLNDLDPAVLVNLRQGLLGSGFTQIVVELTKEIYKHPAGQVVILHHRDVLDQIGQLQFSEAGRETVLYLDPPYPLGSRKDPRNRYAHEMTDDDHRLLLENAKLLRCDVLISTYPNDLYAEQLADWHRITFKSQTRKGMATEWLFLNYDPSDLKAQHDYQFLGKDYREREKYARIDRRWTANFLEMPPLLRKKVLKSLIAADCSTDSPGGGSTETEIPDPTVEFVGAAHGDDIAPPPNDLFSTNRLNP